MDTPQNKQLTVYDYNRAERFYSKLRARIAAWLKKNTGISDRRQEYLLLLPDLFALLIRLLRDSRIDAALRLQLAAVSLYVISPVDLIPDVLMPIGLVDDTVALAFILSRVVRITGEAGEMILREHWEGEGDVLAQIQRVVTTADSVLKNVAILNRLRRRFG
ncbi:MAG: DUF1232 domain-containing protein [Anaerolineae bacterium]|nr:DUF1232 domain-containing protein [Anaerolineae bacterium]